MVCVDHQQTDPKRTICVLGQEVDYGDCLTIKTDEKAGRIFVDQLLSDFFDRRWAVMPFELIICSIRVDDRDGFGEILDIDGDEF